MHTKYVVLRGSLRDCFFSSFKASPGKGGKEAGGRGKRGRKDGGRPGNKAAGDALKLEKKQFLGNCEPLRTTNFQATAPLTTCKKPRLLNGRVSHGLNMDFIKYGHPVLTGGVHVHIHAQIKAEQSI